MTTTRCGMTAPRSCVRWTKRQCHSRLNSRSGCRLARSRRNRRSNSSATRSGRSGSTAAAVITSPTQWTGGRWYLGRRRALKAPIASTSPTPTANYSSRGRSRQRKGAAGPTSITIQSRAKRLPSRSWPMSCRSSHGICTLARALTSTTCARPLLPVPSNLLAPSRCCSALPSRSRGWFRAASRGRSAGCGRA